MNSARSLIPFFMMSFLSFSTHAESFPSTTMTTDQIKETISEVEQFIPAGESTFSGKDAHGQNCQIQSSLSLELQSGYFSFNPSTPLNFGYDNNNSGDAIVFFMISNQLTTSTDGSQKSLHLVIANRGSFGSDRVVAYDLVEKQGHMTSFRSSVFLKSGLLQPGENLSPFFETKNCSF